MKKHINIPIFIPHEGCENLCIFCNQNKITGFNEIADRDIVPEIEQALQTIDPEQCDTQIAFFGGSFTGIDRNLMLRLLADAKRFIDSGKVTSIRLSTRPDYIDDEILLLLKNYGVTDIELGIQSMSQQVLDACKRGHTTDDSIRACEKTVAHGFTLTGQMMVGLPLSTPEEELFTAQRMIELGATCARIYPTVVFHKTALCEMAQNGTYLPMTNEQAVVRSAAVYEVFLQHNIKVLRVGLQSTEALTDETAVYAGANHVSLGELVINELYLSRMVSSFDKLQFQKNEKYQLTIYCAKGETPKVAGHNCRNKDRIFSLFDQKGIHIKNIKITEIGTLQPFEVKTELTNQTTFNKRG